MRRRYGFTESKICRFLKEGRGQGRGPTYRTWLPIGSFASSGRVHRILGNKDGRIVHLHSDLEWKTFLLLDSSVRVIGIREHFPPSAAVVTPESR